MKQTCASFIIAIALAAACAGELATASGLSAQETKPAEGAKTIAGRWTMSVDSPHGAMTMALVLEQDGKNVSGTVESPHGEIRLEGEFADRALKLAATGHDHDSSEMTFTAKLKNDGTLAGYLSSSRGDMMWTAQRAKE